MPTNYGDVALNLGPHWDRAAVVHSQFINGIVGHVNGKADMHIENEPDEEHQFQFVDMGQKDKLALAKMKGYKFVQKSTDWWINEDLFSWTAEGYAENAYGERAMARPKSLYQRDQMQLSEEQKRFKRQQEQLDEQAERAVVAAGGMVTDENGRKLRPARRQARL